MMAPLPAPLPPSAMAPPAAPTAAPMAVPIAPSFTTWTVLSRVVAAYSLHASTAAGGGTAAACGCGSAAGATAGTAAAFRGTPLTGAFLGRGGAAATLRASGPDPFATTMPG